MKITGTIKSAHFGTFEIDIDTDKPPDPEPTYACADCGKLRTKAEGGTTFTVCDECWDKTHKPSPKSLEDVAKTIVNNFADLMIGDKNSLNDELEFMIIQAIRSWFKEQIDQCLTENDSSTHLLAEDLRGKMK